MTAREGQFPSKIVRRFTSELEPDSDLAIQTKQYPEDVDGERDALERLRMERKYHAQNGPPGSAFKGVEIARRTLQSKCDEFFSSLAQKEAQTAERKFLKTKTLSVLRLRHQGQTAQKLALQIQNSGEFTVGQVNSIIQQIESEWRQSNGKARMNFPLLKLHKMNNRLEGEQVATNFGKICQRLNDHRQIFQWFPNQTSYTSVLCGAVAMTIEASVNYSNIAEQLSSYIAQLSDEIGVCTRWLDLYHNVNMQRRLSDIYREFFDFFIRVATWYLKPTSSRWLDSFNMNFSASFDRAAEEIRNSIQLIRTEAEIENAGQVKDIIPHMDQCMDAMKATFRAEIRRFRREENEPGGRMCELLEEILRKHERLEVMVHQVETAQRSLPGSPGKIVDIREDDKYTIQAVEPLDGISRPEAEEQLCHHLQPMIDEAGGSDGINPAMQAGRFLADPNIVHALGKWVQASAASGPNAQILWIMSPWEAGPQTSAQLISLGVIWTAIQAQAQFISYIGQRPPYDAKHGQDQDKLGVLALAYSLILQILQFQPPEDRLVIPEEIIRSLIQPADDSWASRWEAAMRTLNFLLPHTPTLRYLIIYGLSLFESGAHDMCQELVDSLLAHAKTVDWPLRILFTTSGQSSALFGTVPEESTVMTTQTFIQLSRRNANWKFMALE